MKILMLGWEYPPLISGGLATATEGLVNGLLNLGHEVTLVLPRFPFRVSLPGLRIVSPENPLIPSQQTKKNKSFRKAAYAQTREEAFKIFLGAESLLEETPANTNNFETSALVTAKSLDEPEQYPSHYATLHLQETELTDESREEVSRKLVKIHHAWRKAERHKTREFYTTSQKSEPENNAPQFQPPVVLNMAEQTYALGLLALHVLKTEEGFDVVHAHDWMSFQAIELIKQNSHVPTVVHVHSTEYDRGGRHGNARIESLERRGFAMADRLIAVSELTKKVLVSEYHVSPHKIDVVYNASNERHVIQDFAPTAREEIPTRSKLPVVTFVGRITSQKGPAYFVQAAFIALKHNPLIRFLVVGSGDLLPSMKQLVWELGIQDSFQFEGFLDSKGVQKRLASSDVFVMPSVSEPFGIVALEAIAQNIPVIISRQSGVSEVLQHALKVNFWDTELMADRILSLLRRPSLATELSHNARFDLGSCNWTRSARQCTISYSKARI